MSETEFIILIVTAVVSVIGLFTGIASLFLEIKNRRNSLRQHIYEKQVDVYIEINRLTAMIVEETYNLGRKGINDEETLDRIDTLVDELDLFSESNSLISPEVFNTNIGNFINYMNKTLSSYYKRELEFNPELKKEIVFEITSIYFDMKDLLGVEKLSTENTKIARGERIVERIKIENNKKIS